MSQIVFHDICLLDVLRLDHLPMTEASLSKLEIELQLSNRLPRAFTNITAQLLTKILHKVLRIL